MLFLLIFLLVILAISATTLFESVSAADCPTACPYNYAPICGLNKENQPETFGNECAYDAYVCVNKIGKCIFERFVDVQTN